LRELEKSFNFQSDVSTETKKSENADFYRLIPENESLSSVSSDEAISLQCQDLQEAKGIFLPTK